VPVILSGFLPIDDLIPPTPFSLPIVCVEPAVLLATLYTHAVLIGGAWC
jgi:hypothetical protein